MSNRYLKYSKISEAQVRQILKLFCYEMAASKVAEYISVNRLTVNRIFDKIRSRIAELCEAESPFINGEVELDESYFGARRVRGKRRRGARGKIPVFGMLKRGDKVYTQIVKNCSVNQLLPIIQGKTDTNAVITPIVSKHMTDWLILDIKSTIESSMVKMNLQMGIIILTVLRTSGGFVKSD